MKLWGVCLTAFLLSLSPRFISDFEFELSADGTGFYSVFEPNPLSLFEVKTIGFYTALGVAGKFATLSSCRQVVYFDFPKSERDIAFVVSVTITIHADGVVSFDHDPITVKDKG
ncbi:MAG: hypothetical protein LBH20_06035 [Treponema sp.]|jgi:hypothetical protein|nr:hypothetical protein [Treponema sp.]